MKKHVADEAMKQSLFELFASVQTADDIHDLLDDLCTPTEIEQMAQRAYAAKLLISGKTYNEVIEQADISSATLSRVSRCIQNGTGYSRFIKPDDPAPTSNSSSQDS